MLTYDSQLLGNFKGLKQGLSKDSALQAAQISYLKTAAPELTHPMYWANLVLVGNNGVIMKQEDSK